MQEFRLWHTHKLYAQLFLSYKYFTQSSYQCYYSLSYGPMPYIISCPAGHLEIINMSQQVIQPIIKEIYGLTVLYRHIYAVKGTILSHFSRPKVTLKTVAKVNKLDAGTPSCTKPQKQFSLVSMQYSQH